MGSRKIQGELWGANAEDWAKIQEPTGNSGYEKVIQFLNPEIDQKLLDIGCGSGYFCDLAFIKGFDIIGIDASEELLKQAKHRNSEIQFTTGEMEELPFSNNSFDVVCGFNSFQYAADLNNALLEAKRVLKNKGKLVIMIWGNKNECEASTYLSTIGGFLPLSPPNIGGPFSLSENQLLEKTLEEIGFKIISNKDIKSTWIYTNIEIALKGLLAAGPAAKAIKHSGFKTVFEALTASIQPYVQTNGQVIYNNKWRVVISEK